MTKEEETITDGIDVSGVVKQIECLTVQYDKVVEQNKQLQQERMRLISDNNFVRAELNQIKLLLEGKNTQCSGFEERSEKYLKALDEIEKVLKKHRCEDCDTKIFVCEACDVKTISDIIDKAKGVENDR